jgi:septum formation protein
LASASPRRAEILGTLGISFEIRPSGIDEEALGIDDHIGFVRATAVRKLEEVLRVTDDEAFVLAADTIVCVDDERLGQPRDEEDALRMLTLLAGREHVVRTAMALGRVGRGVLECRAAQSRVWFCAADGGALRRYAKTGEGRDKAGAYAVQGMGSGFISRIDGSYTNVVGLPAREVVDLLLAHAVLDRWP